MRNFNFLFRDFGQSENNLSRYCLLLATYMPTTCLLQLFRKALVLCMLLMIIGVGNAWGGTVVDRVANISSGSQYRIKKFDSSHYLTVPASSGSIGGITTTENDGTIFTFTKESTNWYVTFTSGGKTYYVTVSTSNAVISYTTTKTSIIVQDLTIGDGHYIDIGQSGQGTNDWHIRFNTGSSRCGFYKNSSNMARMVLSTAGASTFTVTYNGNGKTSGSVPTDATAYNSGATVTVKNNTGSLVKTGWTFAGWNTNATGTGTDRAAGSTFTISANTTLYAKWTCTVTWSVNGATNVYPAQTITYNSSGSKVSSVPTPDPGDYCGQVFAGWTTEEYSGNSAPPVLFKTVGDSPNLNSTGSVTFYAVFADYDD